MFKCQRVLLSKVIRCARYFSRQRMYYTDDSVIPIDPELLFMKKTNADILKLKKQLYSLEKARQSLQEQINETASIVLQLAEANLVRLQQQEKENNRSLVPFSLGLSEEEAMQNALHEQGLPLKFTEYPSKAGKERLPEESADVNTTTINEGGKMPLEAKAPLESTKEEQETKVEEQQRMENSAMESESLHNKCNIELEPVDSLEVEIDSKKAHRKKGRSLDKQELSEKAEPKQEPGEMWSKMENHDMQRHFSTANTSETEEHDDEMDQMSLEYENHAIQKRFSTKNTAEIEHQSFELEQTYDVQRRPNESLKRLDLDGETQSRTDPEIVQHAPKTIEQQVMALAKEYEMQLKPTDSPTFGFQKVESGVYRPQISPDDVNLTAEEENLHGKITESNRSDLIPMQGTELEAELAKCSDAPISFDCLYGIRPQINEILLTEATTQQTGSSAKEYPPSGAATHVLSSSQQQHMMQWEPMSYKKHTESVFQRQEWAVPSKRDDEQKTPQHQQKNLGATTAGASTEMTELVMEQKAKLKKEKTDAQQHGGKAEIFSPTRNTRSFPHQKDISEQDSDVDVFENDIHYPKIAKMWSSAGNTHPSKPQDSQKPQESHIHILETEIPQYPQITKMWIPTTIAGKSGYGESQPSYLQLDNKLDSPNNKLPHKRQQMQQQQCIKQSEWRSQQEQSETPEYSVVLIESAQEPVGQREPTSQMQSRSRSSNESLFASQEEQMQQQRQQQENKSEAALSKRMEADKDQLPVVLIDSAQEPVGQMEPSLYISPELPSFVPGYLFLRRNSQRKQKAQHQQDPYLTEQAKPLDLEDLPQPATIYMEEMFRKSTKSTSPGKFFPRSSLERTPQSRNHKDINNEQEFQMQTEEALLHEEYAKYNNTEIQHAERGANYDNCPPLSLEVTETRKRRAMESTHLAANPRLQYSTLVDRADMKTRKSYRRVYKKRITDEKRFRQMKTPTTKDE